MNKHFSQLSFKMCKAPDSFYKINGQIRNLRNQWKSGSQLPGLKAAAEKQLDGHIKIIDLVLADGSAGGTEVLLKIPVSQ